MLHIKRSFSYFKVHCVKHVYIVAGYIDTYFTIIRTCIDLCSNNINRCKQLTHSQLLSCLAREPLFPIDRLVNCVQDRFWLDSCTIHYTTYHPHSYYTFHLSIYILPICWISDIKSLTFMLLISQVPITVFLLHVEKILNCNHQKLNLRKQLLLKVIMYLGPNTYQNMKGIVIIIGNTTYTYIVHRYTDLVTNRGPAGQINVAITGKNREGKWEPNELFSGFYIVYHVIYYRGLF